jgi:type I restriction enzyme S subunit
LNNGWKKKSVGEILQLEYGKPLDESDRKPNGRFPVYGANGEKDRTDKFYHDKPSIIVGRKGSAGEINLTEERFWPLDVTYFVTFDKGHYDLRFLYYLLTTLDLTKLAKGVKPGINRNEVYSQVTTVPPLPEQRRIVGILDEAFEAIATAKANAEKNLQNARALFESHLQSVFTQRGPGWKATTLGAEIDLLAGFAFKSAQYTNDDDDIRLLRGDNIIQGCLRWDDVKRWPANDTGEYDRYQLEEGDVVLAMDRPWVKAGLKHATISAEDLPSLLVQRTARLRGGANLNNRFLKLLIGSAAFTSHILGVQTGIGVPHISGQQIKDFEFARPPVTEQRRIADNLESLREETQRLATIYSRKLAALEALKKSLLHQAFTGQL